MIYVITIFLLLAIVLTSEMGRELLISHVGQTLDIAPWIIIIGGLSMFIFFVLA